MNITRSDMLRFIEKGNKYVMSVLSILKIIIIILCSNKLMIHLSVFS